MGRPSAPPKPLTGRRDLLVLGGLAGGIAAAGWAARALRPPWRDAGETPVVAAAHAEPAPAAGAPSGDVVLSLFTDFNCGPCRRAHGPMMEAVEEDGAVRLRFLDWPTLGPGSRDAALVALAAEAQGLYVPLHMALMTAGRGVDGRVALDLVERLGGDPGAVRARLGAERARLEGRLARHRFHAFSLGLRGTPAHLAGPLLLEGAAGRRAFVRLIRAARARGGPGP